MNKVREHFLKARDLPVEQRVGYLAEVCEGDAGLQARVLELLAELGHEVPILLESPVEQLVKSGVVMEPADEPLAVLRTYLQPPAQPGAIGRLGAYEIRAVLGAGAFGIVLDAFDESLQRDVAIKVLHPDLARTSPPRKRFLREARAAAAVKHENVVQIYAVHEEPLPHLVMERVEGVSLQEMLNSCGPLDPAEIVRLGRQIALGLAAAHDTGLVHRDIKPANLLLENGLETKVKLTDFGLARTSDAASITHSGVISGTPLFMAPEQMRGEAIDARSDLFSLGSVLYTMCTGHPPFRAATTIAVLKRVCDDEPRPIREIVPEVPAGLAAVVMKLLRKQPADRYSSGREVADALEHALTARTAPRSHRRWLLAAAIAMGGLGLSLMLWEPWRSVTRNDAVAIPPIARPAALRVKDLIAELSARNPGMDLDRVRIELDGDAIVKADFGRDANVFDLTPLAGIATLRYVDVQETHVEDLRPLRGLPLEFLSAEHTPVSDLTPLKGMPLRTLAVGHSRVNRLDGIEGMPLKDLYLHNTLVERLAPLAAVPTLESLDIRGIRTRAIEPLARLPLQQINLDYDPALHRAILKAIPSLRQINGSSVEVALGDD